MKISVVIPLFNGAAAIRACLGSLLPQLPAGAQVVVVDNGSTDGGGLLVRRDYPGVHVFRNEKNEGAARARNQGVAGTDGGWVITLDCDVVLQKSFFDTVLAEIDRAAPRIGMLQAKILDAGGRRIYSTGIKPLPLRRFADRGQGDLDRGQFDRKKEIFGPCSAAAAYRRSMLDAIKDSYGIFDERFFFLLEDVDLAWRAQRAGWKAVFCPGAVCAHEGNSSKTNRALRQYLCFRNRQLMLKKNEGIPGKVRQILLGPFYDAPRRLNLFLSNPYFINPPQF